MKSLNKSRVKVSPAIKESVQFMLKMTPDTTLEEAYQIGFNQAKLDIIDLLSCQISLLDMVAHYSGEWCEEACEAEDKTIDLNFAELSNFNSALCGMIDNLNTIKEYRPS